MEFKNIKELTELFINGEITQGEYFEKLWIQCGNSPELLNELVDHENEDVKDTAFEVINCPNINLLLRGFSNDTMLNPFQQN